jgi:hypothetical protein
VKRPALLCAAALVALAVWEIAVLVRARAAAPGEVDWAAVRSRVDREHRAGDLVVFAPAWMDPVGRLHLGHHLTVEDAARMDAARYARVWEVSARGASSPDATGRVVADERHGALRLRLLEREPAEVLWDLGPRAKLLEIDYAGRRCVEVRAPGTLDAGVVPLGGKLVARAGLADFRARRDNRATARVRALLDDREVARASVGSESGWVALPEVATTPGEGRLRFEVEIEEGSGTPAVLNVCIAAETRR